MAIKIVLFALFVAAASAQYYGASPFAPRFGQPQYRFGVPRPVPRVPAIPQPEEEGPAEYKFQYQVNEPLTGDIKSQQEERLNDALRGVYSLVQPDGLLRIVEYTANDVDGFIAQVRYEPVGAPGVAPLAAVGGGAIAV